MPGSSLCRRRLLPTGLSLDGFGSCALICSARRSSSYYDGGRLPRVFYVYISLSSRDYCWGEILLPKSSIADDAAMSERAIDLLEGYCHIGGHVDLGLACRTRQWRCMA